MVLDIKRRREWGQGQGSTQNDSRRAFASTAHRPQLIDQTDRTEQPAGPGTEDGPVNQDKGITLGPLLDADTGLRFWVAGTPGERGLGVGGGVACMLHQRQSHRVSAPGVFDGHGPLGEVAAATATQELEKLVGAAPGAPTPAPGTSRLAALLSDPVAAFPKLFAALSAAVEASIANAPPRYTLYNGPRKSVDLVLRREEGDIPRYVKASTGVLLYCHPSRSSSNPDLAKGCRY